MPAVRLSIIVPFYNVEPYIGRCLDSIYRQDLREEEYEVICVDDCSPDNSISIVEQYAARHSNLKIIRNKENRKLGGARNAGLEEAKGNYIWFIDSDDFIEDNVLGYLCAEAEKDDLDVLHFDYEKYPSKEHLRELESTAIMTGTEMFFDNRFIWYHDLITAWRKLYKRSFLIENGITFAEHIMWEDDDYSINVFAKAQKVRHIHLVAYYYCDNPNSVTRVKYNSSHIYYWVDLCSRLERMRQSFLNDGIDNRFQPLIRDLIRFHIGNTFKEYRSLQGDEKKKSRSIIRQNLFGLRGYISRKNFYSFILRII